MLLPDGILFGLFLMQFELIYVAIVAIVSVIRMLEESCSGAS
jgi:hypothetical protein